MGGVFALEGEPRRRIVSTETLLPLEGGVKWDTDGHKRRNDLLWGRGAELKK